MAVWSASRSQRTKPLGSMLSTPSRPANSTAWLAAVPAAASSGSVGGTTAAYGLPVAGLTASAESSSFSLWAETAMVGALVETSPTPGSGAKL